MECTQQCWLVFCVSFNIQYFLEWFLSNRPSVFCCWSTSNHYLLASSYKGQILLPNLHTLQFHRIRSTKEAMLLSLHFPHSTRAWTHTQQESKTIAQAFLRGRSSQTLSLVPVPPYWKLAARWKKDTIDIFETPAPQQATIAHMKSIYAQQQSSSGFWIEPDDPGSHFFAVTASRLQMQVKRQNRP